MKIIVCIKQVPESQEAEMDVNGGVLLRGTARGRLNPFDAAALEAALQIKEASGGYISVLTMGPERAGEVLQTALAMGADEGVLVTGTVFAGADVLATASALGDAVQTMGAFDLLLFGSQTTDGDIGQTGPETAQILSLPCISNVGEISYRDHKIFFSLRMTGYVQKGEAGLPCAACVRPENYPPRIPSLRQRMEAKKREIRILTGDNLTAHARYGKNGSATSVVHIYPAEGRRRGRCAADREADAAGAFQKLLHAFESGGDIFEGI